MMIVSISDHLYSMKRESYKKYLNKISKMIKRQPTIIAVEKKEYVEMRNDIYPNQKELNKAIKNWEAKGYKVRYIRGTK